MKSEEFLEIVETVPEAALREASVHKDHTALLIIDMQNYFEGIAGSILIKLSRTISTCRRANVPVIGTAMRMPIKIRACWANGGMIPLL